MARLTLRLLGFPQIELDGVPLIFPYRKVTALLIYLAVEAHVAHSRASVAALLWPTVTERAARQSLSQALTILRIQLGKQTQPAGAPFVHVLGDTLQLDPQADWQVDVAQFQQLALQEHQHHALRTCAICAQRFQQCIALYQGNFLDQFEIRDCQPFIDWVQIWRVRLCERAMLILDQLIDQAEWRMHYDLALVYSERQLILESWREQSQRTYMRVLALSGQSAVAQLYYEQIAQAFVYEFGVLPEPATQNLYEHIRTDRYALTAVQRYTPPPLRVPARVTPLIGRAADLLALRRLILNNAQRLVTISGAPGIGKTSLAQILAHDLHFDFVDGITFVELASIQTTTLVATAILHTLAIAEQGVADVAMTLISMLRQRQMLLVLDNFEQVLDAAPLISALLQACPALTVVVTSRVPLGLRSEYIYPLKTLALPQSEGPFSRIAEASAVQLFVERAQAVLPHFTLTELNADSIAAICARLDGLPLAIELIAAQIEHTSLGELLHWLEPPFAQRIHGLRDLPERHQTLHNAISWSFNLLTPQEQYVFKCVGVFVGGCTVAAVGAILADTSTAIRILPRLQHMNLLQLQTSYDLPRYTMLEIIRVYAEDMLAHSAAAEVVHRRHAHYYAGLATTIGPSQQLIAEYANLRTALLWALQHEWPVVTLQLGLGLAQVWLRKRAWINGLLWLESIFAQQTAVSVDTANTHVRPYLHLETWISQQLKLAEQHGDRELQRLTQIAMALVYQAQGRYAETQQLLEYTVTHDRTTPNRFPMMLLAELYARTQQRARAYELYSACVQLHQACDDRAGCADALLGLAQIVGAQHALQEAFVHGQAALETYTALADQPGIARSLCVLASLSVLQGDTRDAVARYYRSFMVCDQLHDTAGRADVLEALAPLLAAQGRIVLVVQVISAAAALREYDGTHLTPVERADLNRLCEHCSRQLGQTMFMYYWQVAHTVLDEQLVALIEDVRNIMLQ